MRTVIMAIIPFILIASAAAAMNITAPSELPSGLPSEFLVCPSDPSTPGFDLTALLILVCVDVFINLGNASITAGPLVMSRFRKAKPINSTHST